MSKPKLNPLKPPKISYDRMAKMWVLIDREAGIATQAESRSKLHECWIEALRLVCWTYRTEWRRNLRATKARKP